jgi:hypothetical protein
MRKKIKMCVESGDNAMWSGYDYFICEIILGDAGEKTEI